MTAGTGTGRSPHRRHAHSTHSSPEHAPLPPTHTHGLSLTSFPAYLSPSFKPSQHQRASPQHREHGHGTASQSSPTAASGSAVHGSQPRLLDVHRELFPPDRYASCSNRDGEWEYRRRWQARHSANTAPQTVHGPRTIAVSLIGCLNVDVTPPDAFERLSNPHIPSTLCWFDLASHPASLALTEFGSRLQSQYERWQPKAKYKQCLDPTISELKKSLIASRKLARNDRLLVHFNGFGVPKPTTAGEIWVFNKSFTQYIPVPVSEMLQWVGGVGQPCAFVVDCSGAGNVLDAINRSVQSQSSPTNTAQSSILESMTPATGTVVNTVAGSDVIVLASCTASQSLPVHPSLPNDLFTACLTTPLTVALRYFAQLSPLLALEPHHLDLIPGTAGDRKTPLGELHWILTSITDSIAFSAVDRTTFAKLFRADLLIASLFRHFLLAERVMRTFGITPVSSPSLPSTHTHSLWSAWDSVAESYLLQLDKYIKHGVRFLPQPFFTDQLTAFEAMLDTTSVTVTYTAFVIAPLQLPIVLQVLLSPSHRRRALILLAKFLSKGPSCVSQALDVGIQPYILKLLESPSAEIREVLTLIWARIVAIDSNQRAELVKNNGHKYFIDGLTSTSGSSERQRLMSLFVISTCASHSKASQSTMWESSHQSLMAALMAGLDQEHSAQIRRWTLLCCAKLCHALQSAQHALTPLLTTRLPSLAFDSHAENRSAALYLLSCLIDHSENDNHLPSLTSSDSFSSTTSPSPRHTVEAATPSLTPPASPCEDPDNLQSHSVRVLTLGRLMIGLALDVSGAVREELSITLGALIDSQIDEFREVANGSETHTAVKPKREDGLPPLQLTQPQSAQSLTPQHGPVSVHPNRSPSPIISPTTARRGLFHGVGHGSSVVGAAQTALAAIRSATSSSPGPTGSSNQHPSSMAHPGLLLPLSRAFSEPAGIINNGRQSSSTSSPPALVLGSRGGSTASLTSLSDMQPPSPSRTHSVASSTASLTAPYATPNRTNRSSADGRDPSSPHEQRASIWRCMRSLCQDPIPSVATAAAVITRKVTVTVTDREIFTNLTAKRDSPQLAAQQSHQPHQPFAVGDGILIEHAHPPSSASSTHSADSHEPHTANEAKDDIDGHRRSTVSLNPLRRIASAASNMANMAMNAHHHHLFGDHSHGHGHTHLHANHPVSHSAQSSPIHSAMNSANSSPLVSSHPVGHSHPQLSMLSLLTTPIPSITFDRAVDALMAPSSSTNTVNDSVNVVEDNPSSTLLQLVHHQYRHRVQSRSHRHIPSTNHASMELTQSYQSQIDGVNCISFHPYESLLVACDSKRSVLVLDWERKERLALFNNDNRAGSKMTALSFLNPYHLSLLAIGDDSGTVRLWRAPHERKPELVNAFMGLRSVTRSTANKSLHPVFVMEWIQRHAWMVCAGSSDVVSVWDLDREVNLVDLPIDEHSHSSSLSTITSVASHHSQPLIFTGGHDGSLRCFDLRQPQAISSHALTRQSSPIVKVACTDSVGDGAGELVCASRDGDVIRIDTRFIVARNDGGPDHGVTPNQSAISSHTAFTGGHAAQSPQPTLAAFAVHSQCGLFASASSARAIRVYNASGITLYNSQRQTQRGTVLAQPSPQIRERRNTGSMNISVNHQQLSQHSAAMMRVPDCLAFHPRSPTLAVSSHQGGEIHVYAVPANPVAANPAKPATGMFSSSFIY